MSSRAIASACSILQHFIGRLADRGPRGLPQMGCRRSGESIAFYDPQRYCATAPLRDNLLFGLAAHDTADQAIRDTLAELGLDGDVYRLGLEHAGPAMPGACSFRR